MFVSFLLAICSRSLLHFHIVTHCIRWTRRLGHTVSAVKVCKLMDAIARLGVSLEGRRPQPGGEAGRQENRSYSQVGRGVYCAFV